MALLTVLDVASELRISRSKVYELIKQGDLQTLKIGKLRRVEPGAVADLLHSLAECTR